MRALFDTNILIDFLKGSERAREELGLYEDRAISLVTWMEVLAGARSEAEEERLRSFLDAFAVVAIDRRVAERAVAHRRGRGMRLPDALVWGSAQEVGALLVTRNTRDFPADHPGIRVPYAAP